MRSRHAELAELCVNTLLTLLDDGLAGQQGKAAVPPALAAAAAAIKPAAAAPAPSLSPLAATVAAGTGGHASEPAPDAEPLAPSPSSPPEQQQQP